MDKAISYFPQEAEEKPIDYKYYLFLFGKNLTVLITFFIITVTFAFISANKIPNRYQASAQILVERPQAPAILGITERGGAASWTEDYYNTQTEIMHSLSVTAQAAAELKLKDYFGVENDDAVAGMARGMVSVQRVSESRIFNITASTADPQLAANLANAMARAYVRKNFENSLYYSKEILTWLPQQGGSPDETITLEDPLGGVKQLTRQELINTLPAVQTDQTLRGLREKKNAAASELELLLKQYREKHPLVIKARANLKFLDDSIETEKVRIIENLKTTAEGRYQVGAARLLEEAKVPSGPVRTNRFRIILMAALAELIASFVIVILLDYFDDTVRSLEDFERKGLNLPFLGPIPLIKKKNLEGYEQFSKEYRHSDLAESFRYLRVAINFSGPPESLKQLVFTSCLPHEGKSFVAHNIAVSLAMDGNRTLLVDGDLRRPTIHKTFRMDNHTGLSNYLTSNVEFGSVVKDSFVENLAIVTSGPMSPNPGEILGSDRMKQFLEEARKHYDRVIVDCPPLTGIGDAYVVGSMVGHIIFVIAAGKTPADLIKHTQRAVDKAGIKIIGVILSMVDLDKERHRGYSKHYYKTYTRYYDTDKPEEKEAS